MAKLVFGCGYLGTRVARRWLATGDEVFAVTRSAERAAQFAQLGLKPIVADVLRPASLEKLPACQTVLYAVGYDRAAGVSIHETYVEGLRIVLDALPAQTGKLIYISSTGVYAQTEGQWVDESSACEPVRDGGRACLEAEQVLLAHPRGRQAIVLRMAGIYGEGRIPNVEDVRRGQPIVAPSDGYLNLIHVDDAAAAVLAAEANLTGPTTLLIADGHPVQRREYYAELARLLHAPEPKFTRPGADAPAAARAAANKRVKNDRMRAEIPFELAYPSYREGLSAIVAATTREQATRPAHE